MSERPALFGRSGRFKGITIPLPEGGLTIGRESGGHRLAIDTSDDISRTHCEVRPDAQGGGFVVTDLGSANGTYLVPQEHKLAGHEPTRCLPGQVIRLGRHNSFELVSPVGQAQVRDPGAATGAPNELPRLAPNQQLDIDALRLPYQRLFSAIVWLPTVLLAVGFVVAVVFLNLSVILGATGYALGFVAFTWVSWQMYRARLMGHGVVVGPKQYPQIHALVSEAAALLGEPPPTVVIIQGHGLFELLVARWFSRRGFLIITSNMLDELIETDSSRELMFFIGRQLGLIAAGYFDFWLLRHFLGGMTTLFYFAWERRCHHQADRIGLMVTGDLAAAEHAMLIITAGSGVAHGTNVEALREQRQVLMSGFWAWVQLGFSSYPYMVDRILRLRDFAGEAVRRGIGANQPVAIGALPLVHRPIRVLPLIILHGHDLTARLEVVNFLQGKFPHVKPILMIDETMAARTLTEKFERLSEGARGALALLTPDDIVMTRSNQQASSRARQNVIFEIGWFSARFGRDRLLLLSRGNIDVPSDLAGVELHRFASTPMECSERVRDFIHGLNVGR